MGNLIIVFFKESLEYDDKCDRVVKLCDEKYEIHGLELGRKDINDDEIKCLKKYVFPVLKDLGDLSLASSLNYLILDNQITKIDKDTFSSLSNLQWLSLASSLNDLILDNQITKIDKDTFSSLSNLKYLYLHSN